MNLPFRKLSPNKSTLFCFTPLVSLATFFIEFGFAFYILFQYRATRFSQIAVSLLVCLGLFQLAEYLICTNYSPIWIRLGYVAITLLPALGIHLIVIMTKRYQSLLYLAYGIAAIIIGIVLFSPQLELRAVCQEHFVEVFNSTWFMWLHCSYYGFFVAAAMYILWHSMQKHIGDTKEEKWTLIAYIGFVTPALTLFYLKVISHLALPSVMCGFAIIIAFILVIMIIPRYYQLLEKKKKGKKK